MQEISDLKQKQCEAKIELELFQKEKKSRYYHKKKTRSVETCVPIDSSGDLSNQTSSDSGNPLPNFMDIMDSSHSNDESSSLLKDGHELQVEIVPKDHTDLPSTEQDSFLISPPALPVMQEGKH